MLLEELPLRDADDPLLDDDEPLLRDADDPLLDEPLLDEDDPLLDDPLLDDEPPLRDEDEPPLEEALFEDEPPLDADDPLLEEPPRDAEEPLLDDPLLDEPPLRDEDELLFDAPERLPPPEERPPFAATLSRVDLLADAKPRLEVPFDPLLEDELPFEPELRPDELLLELRAFALFEDPPRDDALLRELALLDPPLRDEDDPLFEDPLREDDPLFDEPLFEDLEEPPRLDDPFEELFDEDLLPEDLLADFLVAFAMFNGFCEEIFFF